MAFTTKFSNGWTIASNSFKVLRENRQLIIFPILSSPVNDRDRGFFFCGSAWLQWLGH